MILQKTIKIKLNPSNEQAKRLDNVITEYIKAVNFAASKIAEIQDSYKESETKEGLCSECNKQKSYRVNKLLIKDGKLVCITCYKRAYSQYTIQKIEFQEKIGIRNIAKLPKSYYANALRFTSDTFTGFDEIKKKKLWRRKKIENGFNFWKDLLHAPEKRREKKFRVIKYAPISDKRENPHYYSEAEINAKIKRLEKQLKKFKMPKYPEFKNQTISLQKELYSWKEPNKLRISSITEKNETIDYYGKKYLENYIEIINSQNPVILLKKEDSEFYLCFPITKEIELPKVDNNFEPVGIDWGITRNIAVMSILTNAGKPKFVKFYHAGYIFNKRKHHKNLRRKLGKKKRQDKINLLGQKEDRFVDKQVHNLAFTIIKEIKEHSKKPIILMEKITSNIEEAEKSMRQHVLLHSVKTRLQNYITYKALWAGIPVNTVDPTHTSQICNKCGNPDRENRPKGSKLFKCTKCDYTCNSDFNASVNIAKKFYTSEYEPFVKIDEEMKTGVISS